MGEALLGAFLHVLLEKLADPEVLDYFGRLKGVNKLVPEKWTKTLTAIDAVLNDAEEKQLTDTGVRLWLDDFRDLAFDVEDILDIFATKRLKRWIERPQGRISKLWIGSLSKLKFNVSMNSEIKKITDRLEEIATREKQLGLKKLGASTKPWKMPPSISQLDVPVIGRDEEKKKIVDELLSKETCTSNFQNFQVVAVVGMPGVGKTTLAKHVFNDAATEQFYPKGWVSVSDDFDLLRVATEILESVTSGNVKEYKELRAVLEKLSKELAGKRFFIVLDDVWNTCKYGQWTTLQSSFRVGAAGSKIVVTTRNANVAKMMGDTNPYNLGFISEDDCWKIFEHHALLNDQTVEVLKEKVIAKCNGLPLAARALGGLLRCKRVDEWEEVLDHHLMLALSEETAILSYLKLSYCYLPSILKRCFTYCAILPNAYEFGEKQLILLWMAEGLIQQPLEENKQMEDLGSDYFQELVSRSFFQKSSKGNSRYIMHDLITDLARWAAGKTCSRSEDMRYYDLPKAGHSSYICGKLSYICGKFDGVKKFEDSEVIRLRTFLPLSFSDYSDYSYLDHMVTSHLFPKLQYLRVLSLHGYQITELPDTMGKLKHLRYLDLSKTLITSLPDSTSTLYNLQTLILESCSSLKALPTNMRNLINLRHLNNSVVPLLEQMPSQLGRLTNLQTLPNFIVGKGSGSGVREIGSLLHLQGTLHLSKLENVISAEDAGTPRLHRKERLEALFLEWSYSRNPNAQSKKIAEVVLGILRPHTKLKELTIKGYAGLIFASWIGDPLFSNMVCVRLSNCNHCPFLPPFGQLPSLKELHIQRMDAVESVGPEFYGECNLPFQVLETLEFEKLKNWKEWSPREQDQGIGVFSYLKMLSIVDCPKLEGSLPEKLDSLAKLKISGCEELVVSISNYKLLHKADIQKCKRVKHTSPVHFELLESLRFSNISELKFQTEAFMKSLKKVKDLEITGSEEPTSSFQNEDRLLQHLISLRCLYIEDNSALVNKLGKEAEQLLHLRILDCKLECLTLRNCASLLKVPEGLRHLTSLQDLRIYECSSLVSFPDVGLPLSLKVIEIRNCNSLLYFAGYQIPPSLRRIQIWNCTNMKSLIEKEEEVVDRSSSSYCLEYLDIRECPSLLSLFKGQFPRALKQLRMEDCKQLELITDRILDDTCQLEQIDIRWCPNLKSLPEGLRHLTNLQSLLIWRCRSLVLLPSMSVRIRGMRITGCEKLKVVPMLRDLQHNNNLNSLENLSIDDCEGLTSFPPNLTSLTIRKIKNCKALLESQGLHRLAFLRELSIRGVDDPGLVSFPAAEEENTNEMFQLPKSLIDLYISGFPNLKELSNGFQFLTSLERLEIYNCPKLASIPEEGLPRSLKQLIIDDCPQLAERCKGRYWPKRPK